MSTRIRAAIGLCTLLAAAPALAPRASWAEMTAPAAGAGVDGPRRAVPAVHLAHRARAAFERADAARREAVALNGRTDWTALRAGFALAVADVAEALDTLAGRAAGADARATAARLTTAFAPWRDDALAQIGGATAVATPVTALPAPRRLDTAAAAIRADLDALVLQVLSDPSPIVE